MSSRLPEMRSLPSTLAVSFSSLCVPLHLLPYDVVDVMIPVRRTLACDHGMGSGLHVRLSKWSSSLKSTMTSPASMDASHSVSPMLFAAVVCRIHSRVVLAFNSTFPWTLGNRADYLS